MDISHALSAAGGAALPALLNALEAEEPWWVTSSAASVLGSIGYHAAEAAASDQVRLAEGLVAALQHPHVWVRRNAADAIGTTVPLMKHVTGSGQAIQGVIEGLAMLANTGAAKFDCKWPQLHISHRKPGQID
jgi:HEAT repeat protein